MTGLRERTIRGAGWMAMAQVASQAVRFFFTVALARLLLPADFGLWGMILVFTGFVALLSDLGLGAALIQMPNPGQHHLSTAFWINTALGILLCVIMSALAIPLSALYGVPGLAPFLVVASTEFIIKGLLVVHRVLYTRDMDFRTLAVAETAAIVISGAGACAMAAAGFGTWSLVAQNIGVSAIAGIWIFIKRPWIPDRTFDRDGLRHMLRFGLHLQGFNLINYWVRNLDKLLVGKYLGEAPLGHYTRAYSTMLLPQSQITGMLERVMWPALARCADNPPKLRGAYMGALRILSFVMFPFMAGLTATSHSFVIALFGANWEPAIVPLRWLCVAGFVQAPVSTTGWLYLATGRTRRMLIWSLISSAVTIPAMIMGVRSGNIEGMAAWYAGSALILAPWSFAMVAPTAALRIRDVVSATAGSASASLLMGGAVYGLSCGLPAWPEAARLAALIIAGAILYIMLTWRSTAARETRDVLRSALKMGADHLKFAGENSHAG